MKILQAVPDRSNEFPELMYHFSLTDIPVEENDDDLVRQKRPQYMFLSGNEESFFVSGRYRGVGSIMKFYKRNAALRWHAQLDTMTSVDAIAVRENAN